MDNIFNDHELRHKFQVTEDVTDVETEKDDREKFITATNDVTEDYRKIELHQNFTANEQK